jgi:hypothetical protein
MRRCAVLTALAAAPFLLLGGCDGGRDPGEDGGPVPVDCADHNPLRNLYFGDLHVHTAYSFDAYVFEVRATPRDAYRFARGEPLALPPLDAAGEGTQTLRLERPLDFAAVTEHSEFIGEVEACLTPGSFGFDSLACREFRAGGPVGQALIGVETAAWMPRRLAEICGDDGGECSSPAAAVWSRIVDAAEEAYDRSPACSFTTFVAYEWTANTDVSTRHRNVIFRGNAVPFPTSYMEQPAIHGLWAELQAGCLDAGDGCDVLTIPHNSNESNGHIFTVEYPGATSPDDERRQAAFRAEIEPLMEIYQHKGDSECLNGVSGILGAPDELCNFEKRRLPPFEDCGDEPGSGGLIGGGCVSRLDYARGALLAGLQEVERIGVNPLRLGLLASTDTHNGTPGAVDEPDFLGHRGSEDDLPEKRLGGSRRAGPSFSPGGLTAVWAEENSRDAIFAALRRREVYGTSGPRIAVRVFGGWDLEDGLCGDPHLIEKGYQQGVPMGATLPPRAASRAPGFIVSALRDAGTATRPGTALQRIQIVKGWVAGGEAHQAVFDVAGDPDNGARVDPETCERQGPGFDSLCAQWRDPDFEPAQPAFYYARVVENPSCRWTAHQCKSLPAGERPASCDDPALPRDVQERAWTSPIWYQP